MVVLIVVRTKTAKFGPGQFKFVLAKTEIPVFGLRQHHQHVAGKDFAVFLPEHVLRDSGSSTDWDCLVLACVATALKLR